MRASQADHALLLGESMDVALRTLQESKIRGVELRFDRIYPHIHFIPMNQQGSRLLKILTLPDWNEALLSAIFPAEWRAIGPGTMEYDARKGETFHFPISMAISPGSSGYARHWSIATHNLKCCASLGRRPSCRIIWVDV